MKKLSVFVCLCVLFASTAQAQETGVSEYPAVEKLIRNFLEAEVRGELVVVVEAEVLSPFGGASQLPSAATGAVTLEGTLSAVLNPTDQPAFAPTLPTTEPLRPPFEFVRELPIPNPAYAEEFAWQPPLGPITRTGGNEFDGSIPPLAFPEDSEELDVILDAAGGGLIVGDPLGLSDQPLVAHGGLVEVPIPAACPGQIFEFGRLDAIEGQPIWQGFAENDIFNGGSQALVTRCIDGQWEVERLLNQGEQFVPTPTGTVTIIFEMGWLSFTPIDELLGTNGSRHFAFVTPLDNPFQPDTTGFTASPFPGLADPGIPVILTDPESYLPGPPVWAYPALLQYSNGSCAPEEWEDFFEFFMVPNAAAPHLFMEQLGTGQVVSGTLGTGPDGTLTYSLDGSGLDFTEHYEWSGDSGTYQHTNGAACTWDVQVNPEVNEAMEAAFAQIAPQVTTTSTTPGTTAAPTTSSSVGGGEEPADTAEAPLWPWILIGLGLLALGLGGFFLLAGKDPCDELRKRWEAAERRRKSAEDGLKQARDYLRERQARVSQLEGDLASLEKAAGSSITASGVTYHRIEEGRVTSEGLRSLTASARRDLGDAKTAEAEAHTSVAEWEGRLADATKAADEARAAYERCVGEHTPKTPPDEEETATTGGPAVAAAPAPTQTRECEREGDKEVRPHPDAKPESVNITVDFSIFVEVVEGSERQVETGKTLALDLSDLAGELGTLGSMLGAYGSGRSVGQGVLGLQTGKYTLGGGKLMRGGVEGYIAGADPNIGTDSFPISIPTSPQEAVTEVVEATARLGSLVAGKVSEWMQMNQLYRVRMTYFYQSITATPHLVWVCRGGNWVCEEQIYEVTVSKLQRRPGPTQGDFRLESDIARHRLDSAVQRMVRAGRSALEQSARDRAKFEQDHQPGPCQ